MAKLDPELKAKWVNALRSGKYKQGRGSLRNDGGFCCLGVLADVIDPDGWSSVPNTSAQAHKLSRRHQYVHFLRSKILRASVQDNLSCMNDGGRSFEEIAKHIESHL